MMRGRPADPVRGRRVHRGQGSGSDVVGHQQLLAHLPARSGTVLDVGGGARHQSLPLARLGFDVTSLDPSAAMLAKAEQRSTGCCKIGGSYGMVAARPATAWSVDLPKALRRFERVDVVSSIKIVPILQRPVALRLGPCCADARI